MDRMQLVRTTLRIKKDLKKAAKRHAADRDITLQEVFNSALEHYLNEKAKNKAKKLVFLTHNLGARLDNLTRDDYYGDPRF